MLIAMGGTFGSEGREGVSKVREATPILPSNEDLKKNSSMSEARISDLGSSMRFPGQEY